MGGCVGSSECDKKVMAALIAAGKAKGQNSAFEKALEA